MRVGDDDLDGVGSGRLEVQRPIDADLAIVGIDAERARKRAAGGRLQAVGQMVAKTRRQVGIGGGDGRDERR